MQDLIYKDVSKEKRYNSAVWKYFLRETDGKFAKCTFLKDETQCLKEIKISNSGTRSLINHLKTHNITIDNQKSICDSNRILKYCESKDISKEYSEMVASSGWSFNSIANSDSVYKGLEARGFTNMIKNPSSIKDLVLSYYEKCKKKDLVLIKEHLAKKEFFSLSIDEWSSFGLTRYLNLILHFDLDKVIIFILLIIIYNLFLFNL